MGSADSRAGAATVAPGLVGPGIPQPRIAPIWSVFGLAAVPAAALGFARFAYALVLPAMRDDLHWSFAVAGALNTANALGYLAGALLAARLAARVGERVALVGGVLTTALAVLSSAATGHTGILLALRLVAGAAGAIGFIVGGGLAARATLGSSPARTALLLGIYFGGGGVGVAVAGLTVPAVVSAEGWRGAWIVLGGLCLLSLVSAALAARFVPDAALRPTALRRERWPARPLAALLIAYGLFGAGYIAYMTFIIAFLRQHGMAGDVETSLFWVVLGVAAIAASFVWGPMLGWLTGGRGAAVLLLLVTAGALLPLLSTSPVATFGSAVLFGGSFLAVVAAVTACARRSLPSRHWTAAIGGLTTSFALGQCLGPLLAGWLSDGPGGVRTGLTIGTVILAASTLTALAQPARHAESE